MEVRVAVRGVVSWLTMCVLVGCGTPPAECAPGTQRDGGSCVAPPEPVVVPVDAGPVDPRQALRDATLFANADFERVDDAGAPERWRCGCSVDGGFGLAACQTVTSAAHGARALQLAPGCAAWQDAVLRDTAHAVRFEAFAQGAPGPNDLALVGYFPDGGLAPGFLTARAPLLENSGWQALPGRDVLDSSSLRTTRALLNNTGAQVLTFDDLVAVQDTPNPAARVGALLHAHHGSAFSLSPGAENAVVWVPLPLDWAAQTPLDVELSVTPAGLASSIEYSADDLGNWGARVHFAADAGADQLELHWDGVMLVRDVPESERPTVFATQVDPARWTQPSPVADFGDPALAQTAASLVSAGDDAETRMSRVLEWTSSHITYGFAPGQTGLDATSVYRSRMGSCTGYGNLASAMGRAVGVPTRTVAALLVGVAQQTHSINEFYLGPQRGWRRVEPQSPQLSVPEAYVFGIRLVEPADEGSAATDAGRWWAMPGVPLDTLVEVKQGAGRLGFALLEHPFSGCAECDNAAEVQAVLHGAPERMKTLFSAARTAWARDVAERLAGHPDPARASARQAFTSAQDLDGVEAALAPLR